MRKGLGSGFGKGYRNIVPIDSHIHSLNAKGVKQKRFLPIASFRKELRKAHIKPFALPVQTAIIVPSTQDVDKKITLEKYNSRIKEVYTKLYNLFGGFTSVEGGGAIENKKTGLPIKEPVNVVVSYADIDSFKRNEDEFIDFVEKKKKQWGQQSMGVIIENELFFI